MIIVSELCSECSALAPRGFIELNKSTSLGPRDDVTVFN